MSFTGCLGCSMLWVVSNVEGPLMKLRFLILLLVALLTLSFSLASTLFSKTLAAQLLTVRWQFGSLSPGMLPMSPLLRTDGKPRSLMLLLMLPQLLRWQQELKDVQLIVGSRCKVLLTMFPAMTMDVSKDDQEGRKMVHVSVMNFSMSKMTLSRVKMDVIIVVDGVVMSSLQMPHRTQSWALLPYENLQAHWAFFWDDLCPRMPQKTLQSVWL